MIRTAYLFSALLLHPLAAAAQPEMGLTSLNVAPEQAAGFAAAARAAGMGFSKSSSLTGRIVHYEANGTISEEEVKNLQEFTRMGGGLLVTISEAVRSSSGSLRLANILPTTLIGTGLGKRGTIQLSEPNKDFFDDPDAVRGLALPFHYELRPWHGIERGQTRHDRYERPVPWIAYKDPNQNLPTLPAGTEFWSRPLLNRDWQIRARGSDFTAAPFLLTGHYGAGRVAVLPTSAAALPDSPQARALFAITMRWLAASKRATAETAVKFSDPVMVVDLAKRTARYTIQNPGAAAMPVQIIARVMTWEPALIGDVLKEATLAPRAATTIEIPLPAAASATSYAALTARDAYRIRFGILSASGATLHGEWKNDADLTPTLHLTVRTEEVRAYDGRLPKTPWIGSSSRMGIRLDNYFYQPSQTAKTEVVVSNGLQNIAPLASTTNEVDAADPRRVALTDGGAMAERDPQWFARDAYGTWAGVAGKDNSLLFTFPQPVQIGAVTLIGAGDNYRNYLQGNPDEASIEIDDREVARGKGLRKMFQDSYGSVRLSFSATHGRKLRLKIPNGKGAANRPTLAEVIIEGSTRPAPAAASGKITMELVNTLTGIRSAIGSHAVQIAPLEQKILPISVALPADKEAQFFRLEAKWEGSGTISTAHTPLLAMQPLRPLGSLNEVKPSPVVQIGFIVTRGFRHIFDLAVGTQDMPGSWSTPDDLIWAYSRGLKQNGHGRRYEPSRLYTTENNAQHYSTPWMPFYNGEGFFEVATPMLIERMKKVPGWDKAITAVLDHSDRWDSGPEIHNVHSWQSYESFSTWLRSSGRPPLTGKTKNQIGEEIQKHRESEWALWQLERYVKDITRLREAFAKEGKTLRITAQGMPLVPGPEAATIGTVVMGGGDDSTWGMLENSYPLTVGRQMGALAFSPGLQLSTLNGWGYDSSLLGNREWRGAVSTTEASRRHLYDRAFRGIVRPDGSYTSIHSFGFTSNAGQTVLSNAHDVNECARVLERHALLTPDGPLGLGLVLSTAPFIKPESALFTAGDGYALSPPRAVGCAVRRLHEAGLSVSYCMNAATLDRWKSTQGLVLVNPQDFSDAEISHLEKLNAAGCALAAFVAPKTTLPARVAACFGVTTDGKAARARACGILPGGGEILVDGSRMVLPVSADSLSRSQADMLAPLLRAHCQQSLQFPPGTAGYGFISNGCKMVVLEDWREEGRTAALRFRAAATTKTLRAVSVNDHAPLVTRRDGAEWIIEVPLRPGDAQLIAITEL